MGNLLNRSLSMLCKYFDGEIKPEFVSETLKNSTLATKEKTRKAFENYAIDQGAEAIIELVNEVNKYVNDKAPWTLAKEEKWQECGEVIYNVLETMRFVAVLIYPFCPNISQDIWSQLSCEGEVADIRYSDLGWGGLKVGKIATLETVKPVFLRLDSEFAGDKKKK
ncbi:MAG: class I tRNA ligase family protein, partial [bacterium]